ncbi:hypothetical protein ACFLU3_00095 [Chloroflexota bacterium]
MKNHINFENWIIDRVSRLDQPFARDSVQMVDFLRELERNIPDTYIWKRTDVDGFNMKSEQLKYLGPVAINRIYWEDMARNIEAWAILNIWRGTDLLDNTIDSLNRSRLISGAVSARSLLELAVVIIIESNNLLATTKNIPKSNNNNQIIISEELEKTMLRLIGGTRREGAEEYLVQKNILTYMKRCAKNPNASELLDIYDYLCEVAHPNVEGYARFQSNLGWTDGMDTTVSMSRDMDISNSQAGNRFLEMVLWSIGWSAVCLRNGFHLLQQTIYEIDERFDIKSSLITIKDPFMNDIE